MTKESHGYYAIIPADVMFCDDLEPMAKLLYGQITSLTTVDGYCWASNEYLAKKNKVDTRTIQRWLETLKAKNFIRVELTKIGMHTTRKIFISTEELKKFLRDDKNVVVDTAKMSPSIRQKCRTNIKAINIKDNPPLSSPPKSKPAKVPISNTPSAEEEDFSSKKDLTKKQDLLGNTTLSPAQQNRLMQYSFKQLQEALAIAKEIPPKKSFMALLMNILQNPSKYDKPEKQQNLNEQQLIALKHNELILKLGYKNTAEANEKNIRENHFMLLLGRHGESTSISLSPSKSISELKQDIADSEKGFEEREKREKKK